MSHHTNEPIVDPENPWRPPLFGLLSGLAMVCGAIGLFGLNVISLKNASLYSPKAFVLGALWGCCAVRLIVKNGFDLLSLLFVGSVHSRPDDPTTGFSGKRSRFARLLFVAGASMFCVVAVSGLILGPFVFDLSKPRVGSFPDANTRLKPPPVINRIAERQALIASNYQNPDLLERLIDFDAAQFREIETHDISGPAVVIETQVPHEAHSPRELPLDGTRFSDLTFLLSEQNWPKGAEQVRVVIHVRYEMVECAIDAKAIRGTDADPGRMLFLKRPAVQPIRAIITIIDRDGCSISRKEFNHSNSACRISLYSAMKNALTSGRADSEKVFDPILVQLAADRLRSEIRGFVQNLTNQQP